MAKRTSKNNSVELVVSVTTAPTNHKQIIIDALSHAVKACKSAVDDNCCQKGVVLGHVIESLVRLKAGMEKHL